MHSLRRNVNLNILLFNNEIYGLTKGQYSPTSRIGTTSPSSPGGSVDSPLRPCAFAVGAGATFIARGIDIDQKGLPVILAEASATKAPPSSKSCRTASFTTRTCFDSVANKKTAADHQIRVEHGHPLIYGKDRHRGLRLNPAKLRLEGFMIGEDGADGDVLVHDETNPTLALMLATMTPPLPTALGVIHRRPAECFDPRLLEQPSPTPGGAGWKACCIRGNVLDRDRALCALNAWSRHPSTCRIAGAWAPPALDPHA